MRILNDFQGANPPSAEAIEAVGPRKFRIRPWIELPSPNYKFRLNVQIVNDEPRTQQAELILDWGEGLAEHMVHRDYVLLGRGLSWRRVEAKVEGSLSHAVLWVPPGEWHLGLHPVYDLALFEADRYRAQEAGLVERVYGRSYFGRELYALECGPSDAPTLLIAARGHPYETAASYCVSGMLQLLAEDLASHGNLTDSFRFLVAPMINPDGVALGCCKSTREGGLDLLHEGYGSDEPASQALMALLAEASPCGFLDVHGWMYPDRDWLIYSDPSAFDRIRPMLEWPEFDKQWQLTDLNERPAGPTHFRTRAHEDYGAAILTPSISFAYRQPEHMQRIGRGLLSVFCDMVAKRGPRQ
jgi:hypothetical protein